MTNLKKTVLLSLLISQSLILSIIELAIPIPVPIPGVKLGLPNIISLFTIITFGFKESLLVMVLRVILSSLITGNMASFIYSLAGGIFSILVMNFMYKFKNRFSLISISVTGSVFHNIGQILIASIVINNLKMFYYLPFLMISGVITGIIIGFTTQFTIELLKRL